jgi:hypothetical protein
MRLALDFFARRAHYVDHLAPIWNALPAARRGIFYIDRELEAYAQAMLHDPHSHIKFWEGGALPGDDPIITAAYGDLNKVVRNPARPLITLEHGVTQGFGTASYPNGKTGNRDRVSFALLPNEYVARRFREVRETPCEVIGTPKMDPFVPEVFLKTRPRNTPPVIAIAFHWGDKHADPPESGSAFEHYRAILPALAARYQVVGHSHPLASPEHREAMERAGMEWVSDFREILRRADVYVNDLSSTMYEFLVTGKPVVVLNAPWFRRSVHWGIRFWDYSDVGPMVEHPSQLLTVIDGTLADYASICTHARRRAVKDLYPYAGYSALRASEVIVSYLEELEAA